MTKTTKLLFILGAIFSTIFTIFTIYSVCAGVDSLVLPILIVVTGLTSFSLILGGVINDEFNEIEKEI